VCEIHLTIDESLISVIICTHTSLSDLLDSVLWRWHLLVHDRETPLHARYACLS
jgi:hypothetical protein